MDYKSEKMLSMIKLKIALKYHLSSYQIGKKQSINTEEKWKFFDIGGGSMQGSEFRVENRNGSKYFKQKDFLQIIVC